MHETAQYLHDKSPFVIAINIAHIKALPSIFNVCITISVLSVANSCAFGSTRTIQALALRGMAPKFMAYVDKHGRPVWCIALQLVFGLLAFVNESGKSTTFFNWLLALSGLSYFFIWGSICMSHIRFRAGWKAQGHSLDELPYKSLFGVWGSVYGVVMNIVCLVAQFYVAVWPIGGGVTASSFFQAYLAAVVVLVLWIGWKVWIREWRFYIKAEDMDLMTGLRSNLTELVEDNQMTEASQEKKGVVGGLRGLVGGLI